MVNVTATGAISYEGVSINPHAIVPTAYFASNNKIDVSESPPPRFYSFTSSSADQVVNPLSAQCSVPSTKGQLNKPGSKLFIDCQGGLKKKC